MVWIKKEQNKVRVRLLPSSKNRSMDLAEAER